MVQRRGGSRMSVEAEVELNGATTSREQMAVPEPGGGRGFSPWSQGSTALLTQQA